MHFIDKSCKAFGVDSQETAADLRCNVTERIGLKEDACFALFEKKDDWGVYHLSLPPSAFSSLFLCCAVGLGRAPPPSFCR